MSGFEAATHGIPTETVSYSIYRGHRPYECAVCGRRVPGSGTGAVYVLDDRGSGSERRVEPDCFERAREAEGVLPAPHPRLDAGALHGSSGSSLPTIETATRRRVGLLSKEQMAILRSAGRFPPDSTPDEIAFGLEVARRVGLDVWLGQVKFLRFDASDRIHPFVGIDGMRAVAERSGQYDGREIEVELVKDLDGRERPSKAVCRVHRKDWSRPLVEEVWFDEAVRRRKDGHPTRAWTEMPVTMLRKAAEERALRAAFPVQLSCVYGEEEASGEGNA